MEKKIRLETGLTERKKEKKKQNTGFEVKIMFVKTADIF